MMLPQEFLERMEQMLGSEYPEFLASYEKERYQSLRLNPCKAEKEQFLAQTQMRLEPVPWCGDGYYYRKEDTPGKHPYHEAGVYYIQEPSAMAPAEYLMQDVADMAEERILDLCSAPGGKSTQIAAKMAGKGILLCNEIHPARARILSENIERMGVKNAMVLNETPQRLAEQFDGFFTRILVDAPCSGEGMFRKNEEAGAEWSQANVELCAQRQDEILDNAASMLAPGGRLVYSTCTFAPAENEGSIGRFLERHTDFTVLPVSRADGMQSGVPQWGNGDVRLKETIRLWPHKLRGEGHYMAVLQKAGTLHTSGGFCRNGLEKGIPEKDKKIPGKGCLEFEAFARENLNVNLQGVFVKFGDQLYLAPEGMPAVKGLKVLRPGLHLGTVKKDRFEPSHALALTLRIEEALHHSNLSASPESPVYGYLNGETFPAEGEKGWYLITVDGYSIGWGKLAGGVMKNHYPKGLRKKLS
jgi:16S rRNA C967 or C1407 C5-methylase (RsmB/RsmF family)/NOL1/NOP2/fmu family ribosome biogenesis protein